MWDKFPLYALGKTYPRRAGNLSLLLILAESFRFGMLEKQNNLQRDKPSATRKGAFMAPITIKMLNR
jgi:hypothetical protein